MIDVHFFPSPNGLKIPMMLEETGLPYRLVEVDILRGAQFEPAFLRISPNNRIPAIVDHEAAGGPLAIFESGAILQYLAEKSGQLLPADLHGRYEVLQWLYWQVAGLGPMAGQAHHFRQFAPEKIPYGRLFDRRRGVLSVDRPSRMAGTVAGGLSLAAALVRRGAGPSGDASRLRAGPCAHGRCDGLPVPLRPDGAVGRRTAAGA
jgi:glutathione S-transferase